MGRKTAVDKLNEAISGILEAYGQDVDKNLGRIAEDIGREGVKALRRKSRETFPVKKGRKISGDYAKGWKMDVKRERLKTTVTLYNDHPALPHLLENGHATKNQTGKSYRRTPAHPHIEPVEKELVEAYEKEVLRKL